MTLVVGKGGDSNQLRIRLTSRGFARAAPERSDQQAIERKGIRKYERNRDAQ